MLFVIAQLSPFLDGEAPRRCTWIDLRQRELRHHLLRNGATRPTVGAQTRAHTTYVLHNVYLFIFIYFHR